MALATMTRWSRSHNFCAVMLLLSPTLSSSFRVSTNSFSQIRFAAQSSRSQRKFGSPLDTADPSNVSDTEVVASNYKRGQPITFSVLRFGPMGASVSPWHEYQCPTLWRINNRSGRALKLIAIKIVGILLPLSQITSITSLSIAKFFATLEMLGEHW